jgi:hypothetical protein
MKQRAASIIGALMVLLLVFPLGFIVHVSPRFPGSLVGSLIGIGAAALMIVAIAYSLVKRVPAVRDRVSRKISAAGLLWIHIVAGVGGAILAVIHTAHKFNSPLGISLTGTLLLLVLSGYVGRYILAQIGRAVRGRKSELAALTSALKSRRPAEPHSQEAGLPPARPAVWLHSLLGDEPETARASDDLTELAGAVADTEYAIRSEEVAGSMLRRWLVLHSVLAIILMVLLVLHIWAGFYYGLRWL